MYWKIPKNPEDPVVPEQVEKPERRKNENLKSFMLKQTREKKIIPVYPEEPADLEERFGPEKPPDPDELESPVTIQNNNKKENS